MSVSISKGKRFLANQIYGKSVGNELGIKKATHKTA